MARKQDREQMVCVFQERIPIDILGDRNSQCVGSVLREIRQVQIQHPDLHLG